jgi:hypothetical protein
MNIKQSTAALLTLALTSAVTGAQEAPDPTAHGDPYIPVGTLAVNPTFVQTGVKPNLDWGIEYPSLFEDLAVVGGSGSILTTQLVEAEIRVNGACFNCGTTNGKELPVAVWVRTHGEGNAWNLIFNGDAYDVDPSKVLFKQWLDPGTAIDIAARGQSDSGSWYPVVWTIEDSIKVAHLANGNSVPDSVLTDFASGDLESFTTAILSDDAMTAEIGPKDMVYLFELSSNAPEEPCFDLQDVVVNVQLKTKNNNGHGNNEDGVDVSNPGYSKDGEDVNYVVVDENGDLVIVNEEDADGNRVIVGGTKVYIDDEKKTLVTP